MIACYSLPMREVIEKLKAARSARGWSAKRVGEVLGVTPQAVANWERGDREPGWDVVQKWAAVLGVEVRILVTTFEEEQKDSAAAKAGRLLDEMDEETARMFLLQMEAVMGARRLKAG